MQKMSTVLLHEILDRTYTMVEVWDATISQDLQALQSDIPRLQDRLQVVRRIWASVILEHTSAPQLFPKEIAEIHIQLQLQVDEPLTEQVEKVSSLLMDLYQKVGGRLHVHVSEM